MRNPDSKWSSYIDRCWLIERRRTWTFSCPGTRTCNGRSQSSGATGCLGESTAKIGIQIYYRLFQWQNWLVKSSTVHDFSSTTQFSPATIKHAAYKYYIKGKLICWMESRADVSSDARFGTGALENFPHLACTLGRSCVCACAELADTQLRRSVHARWGKFSSAPVPNLASLDVNCATQLVWNMCSTIPLSGIWKAFHYFLYSHYCVLGWWNLNSSHQLHTREKFSPSTLMESLLFAF